MTFLIQNGTDEAIDVEGLGFDLEDFTVVCEIGVGTIEYGEIGEMCHRHAEVCRGSLCPGV